jgi:hypothetical protein
VLKIKAGESQVVGSFSGGRVNQARAIVQKTNANPSIRAMKSMNRVTDDALTGEVSATSNVR